MFSVAAITASSIGYYGSTIYNNSATGSIGDAPILELTSRTETTLALSARPASSVTHTEFTDWYFKLSGTPGEQLSEEVSDQSGIGASVTFSGLTSGQSYEAFAIARTRSTTDDTQTTQWANLRGQSTLGASLEAVPKPTISGTAEVGERLVAASGL